MQHETVKHEIMNPDATLAEWQLRLVAKLLIKLFDSEEPQSVPAASEQAVVQKTPRAKPKTTLRKGHK